MPFDVASLLIAHHIAAKRRAAKAQRASAPRAAAFSALRGSVAHALLSMPVLHLQTGHPVSQVIAHDSGVAHPTPHEFIKLVKLPPGKTGKTASHEEKVSAAAQARGAAAAKKAAWIAVHPRPDAHAQPDVITAWLKAGNLRPREEFPEWGWHVIAKAINIKNPLNPSQTLLSEEQGEAIAAVQLGDHDVVTWYEHPSGAWSYYHHWGEDFGDIVASIGGVIEHIVSSAVSSVQSVIHKVTSVVNQVLEYAQIAASVVPGLGQVVNEVVSVAESALDALGGESFLAIALETAYHAILAAAPGLPALAPFIDPVVDVLKQIISQGGVAPAAVHSAIAAALQKVPAEPSIAHYSPRSIAASLAGWVVHKLGLG